LQAVLDSTPSAAKARTADPIAPKVAVPPELSPGDADRFARAQQALQASSARAAYAQAKPLFEAYPNSLAVQDLRCVLATIRWLSPEELNAECAPFKRLSVVDAGADAAR
jgi:hypothetical protein